MELAACIIKVVQEMDDLEDIGSKLLQAMVCICQWSECPVSAFLYLTMFWLSEKCSHHEF